MEQSPTSGPIGREEINELYAQLSRHVRRTPVVSVNAAEFGLDAAALTFKLESLQHTGSFKARGAIANLLRGTMPKAGVVAASGGTHAVAVAFAANKFHVSARIYVPTVATVTKIERI